MYIYICIYIWKSSYTHMFYIYIYTRVCLSMSKYIISLYIYICICRERHAHLLSISYADRCGSVCHESVMCASLQTRLQLILLLCAKHAKVHWLITTFHQICVCHAISSASLPYTQGPSACGPPNFPRPIAGGLGPCRGHNSRRGHN